MIGTWLTHEWKQIKDWAMEDLLAKLYIAQNFSCKETLNIVNSMFGGVLGNIFNITREEKKKLRL